MKFKRLTAVLVTMLIILTGCSTAGEEQPEKEEITVTLPTDLTDEEMAIWETMPQVVTMRLNSHYTKGEHTSTDVAFIEKDGAIREFEITDDNDKFKEDLTIETELEWAAQKFTEADKYEITGTVDVHKLIEFYDVMSKIDINNEKKYDSWWDFSTGPYHENTYHWKIYGARNGGNEVIEFANGRYNMDCYYDDLYGRNAFDLYAEIDWMIALYTEFAPQNEEDN